MRPADSACYRFLDSMFGGMLLLGRLHYEYQETGACNDLRNRIEVLIKECLSTSSSSNERMACYENNPIEPYMECVKNTPYSLAVPLAVVTSLVGLALLMRKQNPQRI
jgi:hypothetical protein